MISTGLIGSVEISFCTNDGYRMRLGTIAAVNCRKSHHNMEILGWLAEGRGWRKLGDSYMRAEVPKFHHLVIVYNGSYLHLRASDVRAMSCTNMIRMQTPLALLTSILSSTDRFLRLQQRSRLMLS